MFNLNKCLFFTLLLRLTSDLFSMAQNWTPQSRGGVNKEKLNDNKIESFTIQHSYPQSVLSSHCCQRKYESCGQKHSGKKWLCLQCPWHKPGCDFRILQWRETLCIENLFYSAVPNRSAQSRKVFCYMIPHTLWKDHRFGHD